MALELLACTLKCVQYHVFCFFQVALAADTNASPAGIVVKLKSGLSLELAVAAPGSCRISAAKNNPQQIDTPMVAPESKSKILPSFTRTTNNGFVGIRTAFGGISVKPETGAFEFHDASGKIITSSPNLVSFSSPSDILPGSNVISDGLNCTVSSRSDCGTWELTKGLARQLVVAGVPSTRTLTTYPGVSILVGPQPHLRQPLLPVLRPKGVPKRGLE